MLTDGDVQFIRDVIKETLECDYIEQVEEELEECLALLEGVL